MTAWLVYLLECADGSYYCGVTTDMERRLAEHNGDEPGGARYTAARRPVRVLETAPCDDRAAACRLEYAIKRARRSSKPLLVRAARVTKTESGELSGEG